jgi:hypothetical protein
MPFLPVVAVGTVPGAVPFFPLDLFAARATIF